MSFRNANYVRFHIFYNLNFPPLSGCLLFGLWRHLFCLSLTTSAQLVAERFFLCGLNLLVFLLVRNGISYGSIVLCHCNCLSYTTIGIYRKNYRYKIKLT